MSITHLTPLAVPGVAYSDTAKEAAVYDFSNWMFSPGCGCCIRPVVGCCDPDTLPATAVLRYTIDGLEPATLNMIKVGSGYNSDIFECIVQADTKLSISASVACFTNYWAISFGYFVYIYVNEFEAVLANYAVWNYIIPFAGTWDFPIGGGAAFGSTLPTELNPTPEPIFGTGRVVCDPCFLVELTGNNTEASFTASDSPQVCDGVSYPFGPIDTIGLNLQIAANCGIDCSANPDELMPAVLNVEATICGNVTVLPNIVYQEITSGNFGWLWAATEVPPVVNLQAIDGCPGSDASFEGHTLCLQAVQFGGCGESPGAWQPLSVGTYGPTGLFSPKGSSGFALTSTSPFDITYTFTDAGDISFGCCGDGLSPFTVRIFET